MTTGLSGTYAFNDVNLTLQPSEGRWVERTSYGIDGSGHNIYSNFRNFELSWDLISTSELKQLIDFFNVVASSTGSVVAACLSMAIRIISSTTTLELRWVNQLWMYISRAIPRTCGYFCST
jgi:hypothetical protein